jgi:hypothetical protein
MDATPTAISALPAPVTSPVKVEMVGYHEDHLLPKKGVQVRIPAGVTVRTTHPRKDGSYILSRAQVVTVHHSLPGQNLPVEDPRHDPSYPLRNPAVVWPGTGGYWCEVDINEVEILK